MPMVEVSNGGTIDYSSVTAPVAFQFSGSQGSTQTKTVAVDCPDGFLLNTNDPRLGSALKISVNGVEIPSTYCRQLYQAWTSSNYVIGLAICSYPLSQGDTLRISCGGGGTTHGVGFVLN